MIEPAWSDPCAGDPVVGPPPRSAEESWRLFGGEGELGALRGLEARFRRLARELCAGQRSWADAELLAVATALRVNGPVRHDRRPPKIAPGPIADSALADAAEDQLPDLAVRVEQVDGERALPDAVNAGVLACIDMLPRRRPVDAWGEEEPDRALVRAARVIADSPPGIFLDGVSLLPRPSRLAPTLEGAPRGPVVARPYRVEDPEAPWRWSMIRALPHVPDAGTVRRRMVLALWTVRLQDRRHTWEDALRVHADVLYRTAAEAASVRG